MAADLIGMPCTQCQAAVAPNALRTGAIDRHKCLVSLGILADRIANFAAIGRLSRSTVEKFASDMHPPLKLIRILY